MHFTPQRVFRVEVAPIMAFALSRDGSQLAAVDMHDVLWSWSVEDTRLLLGQQMENFGAPANHRPESTPRLYNVIELDPEHRWFRVHTRSRPRSGGAWGPWAVWRGERPDEPRAHYEANLTPLVVGRKS